MEEQQDGEDVKMHLADPVSVAEVADPKYALDRFMFLAYFLNTHVLIE